MKTILLVVVALIVKGMIISLTVLGLTHSLVDAVIVAAVSATVTGIFVCISAVMSASITRRQIIDPYIRPNAERMKDQVEMTADVKETLEDTTELIQKLFDTTQVGGRRATDPDSNG